TRSVELVEIMKRITVNIVLVFAPCGHCLGQVVHGQVGHQVPEVVHAQHYALEGIARRFGFGQSEAHVVRHLLAEACCLGALREPRRRWREDVAAMKGRADWVEEVVVRGDMPDAHAGFLLVHHGEYAVVRRDEVLLLSGYQQRAPLRSHARVPTPDWAL